MAERLSEKQAPAPARRHEAGLARTQPYVSSPFGLVRRFADEIDRVFDDAGFGRAGLGPRFRSGNWQTSPWRSGEAYADLWWPEVDVFQRGDQLVIRADLPGLSREDVKVDITDEALTIEGERRHEHEEDREGFYRSERSYGRFRRHVPLPDGAMTEQAKASFRDGVLEVTMPSPPEQTKGRRLEIAEGTRAKG